MPGWNDILAEIQSIQPGPGATASPFDMVRRKYLAALAAKTGRHTILYASRFLQGMPPGTEPFVSVSDEDVQGLMATVQGHTTSELDLILHSPGGSPEAAESVVCYLRGIFTNIRVIVPHLAMSAATMIACAANRVVMGQHSFLGPTDPQLLLNTPLGPRAVPAQAIIEQFQRAKTDCRDVNLLRAWAPMLPQYGPDLLVTCENASKLTRSLVFEWLRTYMLADQRPVRRRGQIVRRCATFLTSHSQHATHGRHLDRQVLRQHGMQIDDLESDQVEQDLVLSIYHASTICFSILGQIVKIIENHHGKAFVRVAGVAMNPPPFMGPTPIPLPRPPSPGGPPAGPAPQAPPPAPAPSQG
jgi:hypothetical protein